MIEEVTKTAQGISDFGFTIIVTAFYLVLTGLMMWAIFKWFKTIIDNVLHENSTYSVDIKDKLDNIADEISSVAECLRPETLLRIKGIAEIYFKYAIERVCRIIKRVREENNIQDHEATAHKIRTMLNNIHNERNQVLDRYTYKGRKLSEYTSVEWVELVAKVVEGEIYNAKGANNRRAYTNVVMVYDEIENDFMRRLEE